MWIGLRRPALKPEGLAVGLEGVQDGLHGLALGRMSACELRDRACPLGREIRSGSARRGASRQLVPSATPYRR
jgi:hypothetical protein